MTISELEPLFITLARKKALDKALRLARDSRVELRGLAGSSPSMVFASLTGLKHPLMVIGDNLDDAGYLYHDLTRLLGEEAVMMFPSGYKRDIKYGRIDPPSQIMRIETLNHWNDDPSLRVVVTYPEALAERVASRKTLSDHTLSLKVGQEIDLEQTQIWLRENGFKEEDYVYEPGHFAVRGSILDVFGYSGELPYRIDLFGDEIESIRTFNIETQLSESKVDSVAISANVSADDSGRGESVLQFVSPDTVIAVRDADFTLSRVRAVASETFSSSAMIADEGDASAMKNLIDPDDFERRFATFAKLHFSAAAADKSASTKSLTQIDFDCSPQGLYHKNFDLISDSFRRLLADGYELYILSDSDKQIDRLKAIFAERGDDIPFRPVLSTLHEGFVDHSTRRCVFTDHQIFDRFHKYTLKGERAQASSHSRSRS